MKKCFGKEGDFILFACDKIKSLKWILHGKRKFFQIQRFFAIKPIFNQEHRIMLLGQKIEDIIRFETKRS
ncbi:hypothetical protein BGP_1839 [Beggiatoa sp. PS]|nr:hypothetical protein BGP_1839 [Beggiatoa sp. PS]